MSATRKMKTMPETVEFLGTTHKFKYNENRPNRAGIYTFVHKGFEVEIDYYGDDDEFDTVTGEVFRTGLRYVYNTRDKARSLKATLRLIERRVRKVLES